MKTKARTHAAREPAHCSELRAPLLCASSHRPLAAPVKLSAFLPAQTIEVADLIGHGDTNVVSWAGPFAETLQTDHAALHQVMQNLIGSAIKHHPGPDCRVVIAAEPHEE